MFSSGFAFIPKQVVLFAPASAVSSAAALDALYFFALAHQQSFDIKCVLVQESVWLLRAAFDCDAMLVLV
jgi:hypothetical protein